MEGKNYKKRKGGDGTRRKGNSNGSYTVQAKTKNKTKKPKIQTLKDYRQ